MSAHNKIANRIAHQHGAEYNRGKGPDIVTDKVAIEVETAKTVSDGFRQLRGFRKPVYIAGATPRATDRALKNAHGTTVGVMDQNGKILKKSSRA